MPPKHNRGTPWGSAMISGIEVTCKVQQPFIPSLPDHLVHNNVSKLLLQEYSFDVEHAFLRRVADDQKRGEQEALEAEKKRREQVEKQREVQEHQARLQAHETATNGQSYSKGEGDKKGYYPAAFVRDPNNQIVTLTPTRGDVPVANGNVVTNGKSTYYAEDKAGKNKDNSSLIRDFDRVDDPFDAAELNTINDMEELRGLLMTSANVIFNPKQEETAQPCSARENPIGVRENPICVRENPIGVRENPPRDYRIQQQPTPSYAVTSHTPPQQRSDQVTSIQFPCLEGGLGRTGSFCGEEGRVTHISTGPRCSSADLHAFRTSSQQLSDTQMMELTDSLLMPPPSISSYRDSPPGSPTNKSVSRNTQSPSNPTKSVSIQPSYGHPPVVNYNPFRPSQPLPPQRYSPQLPSVTPSTKSAAPDHLPPSHPDQRLHEHLERVGALERRLGVSSQEAQQAMLFFPGDIDKAMQYLELKHELLEFGFSSVSIQDILLRVDLDREKAVNLLQSMPLS